VRIALLMDHPSPHMTALLEAIAARKDCILQVLYCGKRATERNWGSHAGNVPHEFLKGFTGPLGIRFNPGILRAIHRLHVDIWVVNTVYTSPTTMMAAWCLHRLRKPWAYMNEPVRPRSKIYSFFKEAPIRLVLDRADGVIATGKAALEMYRIKMRKNCPSISVPYFIDLSEFAALPEPSAPVNGQDIHFITSCQMIPRKGLDYLRQACEKLPGSGWRLTLIGDGPLRSRLEKEFDPHIQAGRVRFLGAIPYQNRAHIFAGGHAFVFPSRWDGWGMVVPEALAAGLPVISSDQVISAHEFIENGQNGFIVPAGDSSALAEKMQWLMQNRSSCSRMSQAARKSVETYTPDSGAAILVPFLQQLAAGSPGNPNSGRLPLKPEQTTWQLLTDAGTPTENARLKLRGFCKDAVIRANLAVHRSKEAKGHQIVGYHLVLKEDKSNFEDQLKFFSDHFQLCSIPDLLQAAASEIPNETRLAITFDDGFRLLTEHCLDILGKYKIRATFFVPSAFVSSGQARNGEAWDFSQRAYCYSRPLEPMRPEDLRKLVELGHEVGSHGMFHTEFHAMTQESAQRELATSRSMIAGWTGVAPSGYCYPYGGSASALGNPASWLREAGYAYGLTLTRGCIDQQTSPFALPRHHLEGNWPIHHLRYFLLD
jgi:glycosyltransferase involved in cell wall biosynthesis/peptidoglycan/xylan/chitin deacetylase (PgdA/CDA1 family)